MLTNEANSSLPKYLPNSFLVTNHLYSNLYPTLNIIFVFLSLPIVNFFLIPYFPKITIRARIGAGLVLYCIGNVIVVIIHAVKNWNGQVTESQFYSLLLPTAIFGFAEVLTNVSCQLNFLHDPPYHT